MQSWPFLFWFRF
uniref:Uncharacterized protein n=1 Tax=Arundo donax TaxID=35708 RepID=A0A0A9HU61_ARUDO